MRRKVLLVTILILSMLLQCVMPIMTANAETSVAITLNSNLYNAVKKNLQDQGIVAQYKDSNHLIVISDDELAKVTKLDLQNSEIDDLSGGGSTSKGLNAFENLNQINLHANYLTEDSNLDVLSKFEHLAKVDLSSNQIADISAIKNYDEGKVKFDITNQVLTQSKVVKVDEDETSGKTQAVVDLPKIFLKDETFGVSWIGNNGIKFETEIIPAEEGLAPSIDYTKSFGVSSNSDLSGYIDATGLDAESGDYPYLVLNVAKIENNTYTPLNGIIKIRIEIPDSKNALADSVITLYYSITDGKGTGIIFKDENLYKAVKEQLTQGQTVNNDETLKGETDKRNLYQAAYDDELILVINDDDLVNYITSLVLHDKKIRDLTGLQDFVGLQSDLDISYNYITSIQKVIELQENKIAREEAVRTKYNKALADLKAVVTAYEQAAKDYDEANKAYADADKAYNQAVAEYNAAEENAKASKVAAVEESLKAKNEANDKMKKAKETQSRNEEKIYEFEDKLYKVYKKESMLVTLLPVDVVKMNQDTLAVSTKEVLQPLVDSIIEKVSKLDENNGLTNFEKTSIENMLTSWGDENGITFAREKEVEKVDPQDPTKTITEKETVEHPISEFLKTAQESKDTLDREDYAKFIYMFKSIDAISQVEQYTNTKRTFRGTTDDYSEEALKVIKSTYKGLDLDYSAYNYINNNSINITYGGFKINLSLNGVNTQEDYKLVLGHKLNLVTDDEVNTFICLPRLKKLNMADNSTRTLEALDSLPELEEINAWKNMVDNISNVDWSKFTNLKVLNLGNNQISDISPLEVIHTLTNLNVSYNLLEGKFGFNLINMKDLREADFSHNQYNDISYINDQYMILAIGYYGNNKTYSLADYLNAVGIKISFQYQETEIATTIVKSNDDRFVEFDLPLIFRQLEEMDNARTSFGVDSSGEVSADGRTVKLPSAGYGTHRATVTVDGRNGYEYTTDGMGFGTKCTVRATVVENTDIPVTPDDPVTPDPDPVNPDNPNNPDQPEEPVKPDYGYPVSDGFVYVYYPETSLVDFASRLVDLTKYDVKVTENKTDKIGTSSVVSIVDKNDNNKVYDIFEVVVKGDINGDGSVDALDSGLVRAVINDTTALNGSFEAAADVNSDGTIDSLDSMMILKYRADRIANFED